VTKDRACIAVADPGLDLDLKSRFEFYCGWQIGSEKLNTKSTVTEFGSGQ